MSAQMIDFPLAKKRGPKVRRGPCAQILQFPVELSGEELKKSWYWLYENQHRWNVEALDGDPGETWKKYWDIAYFVSVGLNNELTEARMRREIDAWRASIEKRTQVMDWMESIGLVWEEFDTPERALFSVYDVMQSHPVSA